METVNVDNGQNAHKDEDGMYNQSSISFFHEI